MQPLAFDFFCGMGGFSLGLIQAGYRVVGAMDKDFEAMLMYLHNLGEGPVDIHFTSDKYREEAERKMEKFFKKAGPVTAGSGWRLNERRSGKYWPGVSHFFFGDVEEVEGEWILEKLALKKGELDLIVGGPPCQGFSTANRKASPDDIRNRLVMRYADMINAMVPKSFAMEEVPGITRFKLPDGRTYLEAFIDAVSKELRPRQLKLF